MTYIIIAAAFVAICIFLFLLGKRNIKSYILVAVLAAIAVLLVTFVDFSSKEEYYNNTSEATENTITTSIRISCETIKGECEYSPESGVILEKSEIILNEGATAFDQLVAATRKNEIQFENKDSMGSAYIAGLNYIYEKDFGDLSGWMFKVNGKFSEFGCSGITLNDGDYIEWVYTKEMGADVGYVYGE